ncbi:hypothetical protein Fleli_0070 [Bernardetia litoralis DSM 6794]|uniref:Uncharacterized protein n=2 Tax=Bernardetia litoralis TaxID=999 RepID=I4AF45_BERLS|nr:hypothetical protein Fleli_0070 [Bernardetia litoralis DSM 6794]
MSVSKLMKRILISLSDSEKEQKEEKILKWLEEENIQTEALENYVQTEIDDKLKTKEIETDTKIKQTSKKMRLMAVVSLGVILVLGGLAFFQMLETDKQKELLKESQEESKLHRQVVQQLQDSIIAREMRHKAVISKQLSDSTITSKQITQ